MTNRFQKAVVGTLFLSASGLAAGYGCPAVIDSVWQAGMIAAQSTMIAAIGGMVETVSATRSYNLQRVQSALRVLTKQIDVSNEKGMATELGAKQAGAGLMVEISNRKAIFNTMIDYNAATGQGFDPCGELKRSQNVAVAIGEAATDMNEKVIREIDAAPGRVVLDPALVISKRMADAKSLYCTPDEAKAGICAGVGKLSGKDVDAANFFSSYHKSSDENAAKSALLNNMYGVPYQALSKDAVKTAAGQSFAESKRNEDAIRSVSQASMKAIQSWTESRGTGTNGSDSVLDALSKKVGTYSGGENYPEWEKSKASQSERGLLVEYAKMAAAELYMLHTEYQQTERIEANISTWLALRSRNMSSGDAKVQAAAAQSKVR